MFVAGDDNDRKKVVLRLVADAGFEAVDLGALRTARLLEPFAMLWIELGRQRGHGSDFSFACSGRPDPHEPEGPQSRPTEAAEARGDRHFKPGRLHDDGVPVGFWWSELTHPYYVLTERGYELEIFSPDGGACEADSMSDPCNSSGYSASAGFIATPSLAALATNTKPVSAIDVDAFATATDLHAKFVAFYEAGKMACALCHGTAILRYAKLSDGTYLAAGKTVTGFANVEEDFADNVVRDMNLLPRDKHVMPWRIEDELGRIDANYVQAGIWRGFDAHEGRARETSDLGSAPPVSLPGGRRIEGRRLLVRELRASGKNVSTCFRVGFRTAAR